MVYDSQMGMDLLFGGTGPPQGPLNDTWAWNGHTWLLLHPAMSPPPRDSASMAYDAASQQVVLFGGVDSSGNALGDTWTWDGSSWKQQHPASSPSARDGASMVYDTASQQIVLFGGEAAGNGRTSIAMADTWTWDGSAWTQLHPASSPPARFGANLAYDAASQQMVLFGGGADYPFNDMWTWDGNTWMQLHLTTSPPARIHASMVYDAASQLVVLFGGEGATVPAELADTWTWNGSTWTQQPPMPSPSGGFNSATYDAAHQYVLVLTTTGVKANVQAETWIWQGAIWKELD